MARASSGASVVVRAFMSRAYEDTPAFGPALSGADLAIQPVDRHHRPGALVGERVVVERPVEVERHRRRAMVVRRGAEGDGATGAQPAVVRDRVGDAVGLG